jgi:hypothetical protein
MSIIYKDSRKFAWMKIIKSKDKFYARKYTLAIHTTKG